MVVLSPIPDRDTFAYFEHDADIGISGRGDTLEESFEAAAHAMFAMSRIREWT